MWKLYRHVGWSQARPYVPGEDLSNISVSAVDVPEFGGMIARNPNNHDEQWYVAKGHFEDAIEGMPLTSDAKNSCVITMLDTQTIYGYWDNYATDRLRKDQREKPKNTED